MGWKWVWFELDRLEWCLLYCQALISGYPRLVYRIRTYVLNGVWGVWCSRFYQISQLLPFHKLNSIRFYLDFVVFLEPSWFILQKRTNGITIGSIWLLFGTDLTLFCIVDEIILFLTILRFLIIFRRLWTIRYL